MLRWGAAVVMAALALGVWVVDPTVTRADPNGEKHEDEGGHAHVPAPLEYADRHVPPSVWTVS